MNPATVTRAVVVWIGILVLAIANGLLREAVLMPWLGREVGFVASGLMLSAAILMVAWLALPWLRTHTPGAQWAVGAVWLVLTLVFEFAFGLLSGQALEQILAAYTFTEANLWPLVLLITLLAPRLAARLRPGL